MEEYKTTININLNGAGVQYHVKEDVETVIIMFKNIDYDGSGQGFKYIWFYDVKERDEILPMVIINPLNCASIEVYESYSVRKGDKK